MAAYGRALLQVVLFALLANALLWLMPLFGVVATCRGVAACLRRVIMAAARRGASYPAPGRASAQREVVDA